MNNQTPFFSIIMPVYNAEKYIEQSINSVLNQTFTNFELIIIDDCSKDSSYVICEKFKSDCILIKQKENKGISYVRNLGLKKARGKYITFLDSDDYIEKNTLEKLYEEIKLHNSDFVMYGFIEDIYDNRERLVKNNKVSPNLKNFIKGDELKNYIIGLQKSSLFRYVWNKAYRKSIMEDFNIVFPNYSIGEDVAFNIQFASYATNCSVLSDTFLHYRRRGTGSLMGRYYPNYWNINYKIILSKYYLFKKWNKLDVSLNSLLAEYIKFIFLTIQMSFRKESNLSNVDRRNFLKERQQDFLFTKLKNFNDYNPKIFMLLKQLLIYNMWNLCIFVGYMIYLIKQNYILWMRIKGND